MFYRFTLVTAIALTASSCPCKIQAQSLSQVKVFAQTISGDLISIDIENLFTELKKAAPSIAYPINPPLSLKGEGILFLQTNTEAVNTVKLPASLRRYGSEGIFIKGDLRSITGSLYLEGVPPYLALDTQRMLVPAYLKK